MLAVEKKVSVKDILGGVGVVIEVTDKFSFKKYILNVWLLVTWTKKDPLIVDFLGANIGDGDAGISVVVVIFLLPSISLVVPNVAYAITSAKPELPIGFCSPEKTRLIL